MAQTHQHQHRHDDQRHRETGTNRRGKRSRAGGLSGARLQRAVRYNKSRGYGRAKVRNIQNKLGVRDDGVIGPQTTRAVYAFQAARSGLSNDGMLGPQTLKVLMQTGGESGRRNGRLTPPQLYTAIRFNRQRNLGRAAIRKIQGMVGVPEDGVFGPMTTKAIARWQANKGLVADGKVGTKTLDAFGLTNQNEPHTHPDPTPIDNGPVPQGNVTANFSWAEFHCNDGTPVPAQYRGNVRVLAQQLEVLRAEVGGRSMHINSGYRSPTYNRRVGGASNSQHLYGKAADITVAGLKPSRVRQVIYRLIKEGRLKQGGVGSYNTFTHYDTRGYAARW